MKSKVSSVIIDDYFTFIKNKTFPCVGAKAALERKQIDCMVAESLDCNDEDDLIIKFLYNFVDRYRANPNLYHSAAIIFKEPEVMSEVMFDQLTWQRLQALSDVDALRYPYDPRVDRNPLSCKFSFSIKSEAFYIVGLHPASSRKARQFRYPTLVFNPHNQFEELRRIDKYTSLQRVIRSRDKLYSGTINPTLTDFGELSEVFQYTGLKYDANWKCPYSSKHAYVNNDTTS